MTRLGCQAILASAGSGKTHTISGRFVALLALGAEPADVFASTFTKKAAGEILSRVLKRLADGAVDDAAAAMLRDDAHRAGYTSVAIDRGVCATLLGRVIGQLHRLDIGTLDSFFVRAATCYGMELGLPPGWTIADAVADERIRVEAVSDLLGADDHATLLTLLRNLGRGDADRSVHEQLVGLIDSVVAVVRDADAAAWSAIDGKAPGLMSFGEIAEHIDAYPTDATPLTKAGQPRSAWVKAAAKVFECLRQGDVEELLKGQLVGALLAGGPEPEFSSVAYPPPIREWLERVIEHARALRRREMAYRLQALRGLGIALDHYYRAAQHRHGAFRFDDVTDVLGGETPLIGRDETYFRLDTRLRHILLDEFQDTSRRQWAAMSRLIGEAAQADGDRAVLVVADPKQSIYGWRGGEPRITTAIVDRFGLNKADGSLASLPKSYRSSQVVLDAVNGVFGSLPTQPALGDYGETVASWCDTFEPHCAAKALPGYVRLGAGPEPARPRAAFEMQTAMHAAQLIADVAERAPHHTVGVLVRTNPVVARLRYELGLLGVRSSEEGGNPLTDSPAVEAVLALLRLAGHPGHTIARYHVATTPIGPAVGLTDYRDDAQAARVAFETRRRLAGEGYGPVLGGLIERVASRCDARDLRRLLQLVEMGWRYEADATLRPSDFVRLAEVTRVEDPTTARVRVMTVHQSKGLEFDAVVLVDLHRKLVGRHGDLVAERADPLGPITRLSPSASKPVRALLPEVDAIHRAAESGMVRDALSGLYVAMTRARHALHLVVRPGDAGGAADTLGGIVRGALAPGVDAKPGEPIAEWGDANWHESAGGGERPHAAASGAVTLKLASPTRGRSLPRRSPSELAGRGEVRIEQLFAARGESARQRGIVVHAWCELIEWLDDGLPGRDALAAAAQEAGFDGAIDGWAEAFASMLTGDVAGQLSRATFTDGATVMREQRFAVRLGDAVVQGMIDRLTVERDSAGKPVRAVVHDFKTDRIPAGDDAAVARLAEHYTPQLNAYRAAAAQMLALPESAVEAKLLLLEVGRVVDV